MKTALLLFAVTMTLSQPVATAESGFYDFKVEAIDGSLFDFNSLRGKRVMIVNTASRCGLTPQYEALEKLYREYGASGNFVIIGFPANNFANQEPGTNEEILEFCTSNYGVTFPMMSKISVRGDDMHPLYRWLTKKEKNGVEDSRVTWNFQKYLIDENGELADVVPPRVRPDSERIVDWITGK